MPNFITKISLAKNSTLYWPILVYFCVFFVQWSVFPLVHFSWHACSISTKVQLAQNKHKRCKNTRLCKILPKELSLSVFIGTFLTNYDVTYRKLLHPNTLHCTKTNKMETTKLVDQNTGPKSERQK